MNMQAHMTQDERKAVGDISPPYARQAQDELEIINAETDAYEQNIDWYAKQFTRDFLTKRMTDTTTLEPRRMVFGGPMKGQMTWMTVGDIAFETIDHVKGPSFDDVFDVVQKAANSGDKLALDLVEKMAATFAKWKVKS